MAPAYLVGIALVTAVGVVVAASDGSRARLRRLVGLLGLWALVIGLGWPASRLTLDLAFVFGSQLTLLLCLVTWLVSGRRRAAPGPSEGGR